MSEVEDFLSLAEEQAIVQAIALAEKNTSGEIRVHIENHSETPPIARAQEVFNFLKMYQTEARNGVLFYVGVTDKTFAIIGDIGIDDVVETDFWDSTKDLVIEKFKEKKTQRRFGKWNYPSGRTFKNFFPL